MASLGQELKNKRTELKEHRINALEGNQKLVDRNQKGRQNPIGFCGYCRTNGHIPKYCRNKTRDEEIKKLQNEATAEKKVTFPQDYNKRGGPSHGSGNWTSRNDDNGAMMSTPRSFTRGNFRPSNQNPNNFRQNRPLQRGDYTNNNNDLYDEYRARSPYQSNQDQSRNWGSNNNYSRLPSLLPQDSSFADSRGQPGQIHLTLQCLSGLGIETRKKIYPTKRNSQFLTTVTNPTFRYTTTDDEINQLSGLCPLNY